MKKRWWIILGGIVFLGITTFFVWKWTRPEISHWDELNQRFIEENKTATPDQIVFLGDSLTEGFSLNQFLESDYVLYNRGIGGDTTEGVLERLESNVLCIEPRIIVLLIGTNDVHLGKTVEEIETNLRTILQKIVEELPETEVYLESMYPTNDLMLSWVPDYWNTILAGNIMIQTVANDFGFTFIDIHPLLLSGEELDRSMSGDGIHLNALGYEIVASELVKNISELRIKD